MKPSPGLVRDPAPGLAFRGKALDPVNRSCQTRQGCWNRKRQRIRGREIDRLLTYKSTKMLTQMATFDSLLDGKPLTRVTLKLPRGQFHERKFYAFPECLSWMKRVVPTLVSGRVASDFTPKEQLIERLRQWMSGDPMEYGRVFHDMDPKENAVWEMKTADLRIFGWIYRPREFIAVCAGYADDYKEPTKKRNYADDRRTVVNVRNALPLDGEKYAKGKFHELV